MTMLIAGNMLTRRSRTGCVQMINTSVKEKVKINKNE